MRVALLTTVSLLFAACATQQENPNYQYSSVYDRQSGQVATRDVTYRVPGRAGVRQGQAVAVPGLPPVSAPVQSMPVQSMPVQSMPVQSMPVPNAPVYESSPTEDRFAGEATPGHQALSGAFEIDDDNRGVVVAVPTPSPTPAPAPRAVPQASLPTPVPLPPRPDGPVDTRPPQAPAPQSLPHREVSNDEVPTLTISGPIHQAFSGTQSRALIYRVQAGDTVYSIARDYCTTIDAVRAVNDLDTDYGLSAGEDIKVPSLCE